MLPFGWRRMVGWGVRGLCRQLRRLRLVRYGGFPVTRLGKRRALGGSVCALWGGVRLRDAIAWDRTPLRGSIR